METNTININNNAPILEKEADNAKNRSSPPLFEHEAVCDNCEWKATHLNAHGGLKKGRRIVGVRYKCMTCSNFDLCHQCFLDPSNVHRMLEHRFEALVSSRKPEHPLSLFEPTPCHSRSIGGPDPRWYLYKEQHPLPDRPGAGYVPPNPFGERESARPASTLPPWNFTPRQQQGHFYI
jgi:hypothetical protein